MSAFLVTLSLVITALLVSEAAGQGNPWPPQLPEDLLKSDIAEKLHYDPNTTAQFSTDYGHLSQSAPAAVLSPSSPGDIATLFRLAHSSSESFSIAARGNGHSVRGQAFAPNGVVVDMASLGRRGSAGRINVSTAPSTYVDAGGEQLWINVLQETLKHGLSPRSWTDYLYLTVGGTLSNAGISGQAFRHGPQISNVFELDVITGKGEMITCSPDKNSDLFYGVLGGLGQFGIITRARIALEPAPQRARWLRLFYTGFSSFTSDQELLISMTEAEKGFDYVEGQILREKDVVNSSFYSAQDTERIKELAAQFDAVYLMEGAVYYDSNTASLVDQKLESLLKQLSFVPGFAFTKDVPYLDFLNRVQEEEAGVGGGGGVVLHPWLNLFLPKSRIQDFEMGVFKGVLKYNNPLGLVLIYPMNKNKWNDKMSASVPNEDVFYTIGLLQSAMADDWKYLDNQNDEILKFCDREGIEVKQYLPHYTAQVNWMKQFGPKWDMFVQLKKKYDPKELLSPGQQIFVSSL